jgi:hypothetical protein
VGGGSGLEVRELWWSMVQSGEKGSGVCEAGLEAGGILDFTYFVSLFTLECD